MVQQIRQNQSQSTQAPVPTTNSNYNPLTLAEKLVTTFFPLYL